MKFISYINNSEKEKRWNNNKKWNWIWKKEAMQSSWQVQEGTRYDYSLKCIPGNQWACFPLENSHLDS